MKALILVAIVLLFAGCTSEEPAEGASIHIPISVTYTYTEIIYFSAPQEMVYHCRTSNGAVLDSFSFKLVSSNRSNPSELTGQTKYPANSLVNKLHLIRYNAPDFRFSDGDFENDIKVIRDLGYGLCNYNMVMSSITLHFKTYSTTNHSKFLEITDGGDFLNSSNGHVGEVRIFCTEEYGYNVSLIPEDIALDVDNAIRRDILTQGGQAFLASGSGVLLC